MLIAKPLLEVELDDELDARAGVPAMTDPLVQAGDRDRHRRAP